VNRIAKPNNVTRIGDWSWKQESAPKVVKPVSARTKKKQELYAKRMYLRHARKQAHAVLKKMGQPILVLLDNRELAARLCKAGLIQGGPYGKKTAATALVEWYKSISPDKRIKSKPPEQKKNNPKSDEFLQSWAWTNLRYRVLKAYGRQCQCCGAKPPAVVLHVDHIKPRSLYPELALEFDNLQVLCHDCNKGKSNKFEDDFRAG